MTEHVHEWTWASELGLDGNLIMCRLCSEIMQELEIKRRLNATERLSAEDAIWSADVLNEATNDHGVNQSFGSKVYYLTQVHEAYVAALEGPRGTTKPNGEE